MIQCFNCQDWYHNNHLLPPILAKSVPEEYILICRRCAAQVNLISYSEFMLPIVRENVEKYYLCNSESNQKRQRTDQTSCKAVVVNL